MKTNLNLKEYLLNSYRWTSVKWEGGYVKGIVETYSRKGIFGVYLLEKNRRCACAAVGFPFLFSETDEVKKWLKINNECWIKTIRT